MTTRTDAIVLRRRDLREHDRTYTLYTRELGKVEALARGARKIKSRMAGHLSSFAVVDVMLARGRGAHTLAGTDVVEGFGEILQDPDRLEVALAAVSLLDLATKVHVKDQEIFQLLRTFLATIAGIASVLPAGRQALSLPRDGALGWFAVRLFSRLGYNPMLTQCVLCKTADQCQFFDPRLGGVVCTDCKSKAFSPNPITPEAVDALRALQYLPYPVSPPRPFGYIREYVESHLETAWPGAHLLAA